jgi:hypothetical protein
VARRFPNSTFVELANSFHVTAIRDQDRCASRLYIRFLRRLSAGGTACARRIGDVRLVPRFSRRVDGIRGVRPSSGDRSRPRDRRLAAVAAATVADVVARWWVSTTARASALRGGTWWYSDDGPVVFRLQGVRLVPRVPVSGVARWYPRKGSSRRGKRAWPPGPHRDGAPWVVASCAARAGTAAGPNRRAAASGRRCSLPKSPAPRPGRPRRVPSAARGRL